MRVALISCVKGKRPGRHQAKDLYVSALFRFSWKYASNAYTAVYILSAKHGLVHPEQRIRSYDLTLKTMSIDERRRWARRVVLQIQRSIPFDAEIHFLCGKRYYEFLRESLRGRAMRVPLRGLGLGKKLQWYKNRTPS